MKNRDRIIYTAPGLALCTACITQSSQQHANGPHHGSFLRCILPSNSKADGKHASADELPWAERPLYLLVSWHGLTQLISGRSSFSRCEQSSSLTSPRSVEYLRCVEGVSEIVG
ncbi:uncharacterized protein CC84DRAFT_962669 [Paraphaeosphaeria sporulosa]|uniref:Uncharacterized protein n=1 Tax=Paraphaeosphaeria sporulosa TaxID=1460663 RepID=A0A177C6P9_9PLEO|nr:uncharacterized protein CC84DRAFT_962669 [Paraphaeosphaeria sporulosa]OAG03205.1 hypothetical protein CC84DRAFT_962669 [Paraphaeosphaeria sporulosa]